MRTRSGIWNLRWETYAEKKLRLNNKKNINVLKDKEVIFSDNKNNSTKYICFVYVIHVNVNFP